MAISINRIKKDIKKSNNFDKTGTNGIINLGQYTFVKIPLLEIKLCVEKFNAVEK